MNVELASDLYLREIFRRLLLKRDAFVEVGLGSMHFSFTWAAPMGFPCYAVEPLPTPQLREALAPHAVKLFVGAIASKSGPVDIFLGELDGFGLPDISSLNPNWWGCGEKKQTVPALTLPEFLEQESIGAISCLKIDTEGSEPAIIASLPDLSPELRPEVIHFEYGGGGIKREQAGGWGPEFFAGTVECLQHIRAAGYRGLLLFEKTLTKPRWIDLETVSNPAVLFEEGFEVGNIVCFRLPVPAAIQAEMEASTAAELHRDAVGAKIKRAVDAFSYYSVRGKNWIKRRIAPGKSRQ